jgi:hypothetical protein
VVKNRRGAIRKSFVNLATTLIKDWRILMKYYRQRAVPHLIAFEDATIDIASHS